MAKVGFCWFRLEKDHERNVCYDLSSGISRNDTYDHRTLKTRLPVRSALFKQRTGGLVVRWVTTSEYPLLYVFAFLLAHQGDRNTGSALDGVVFVFARAKAVVDSAGESAKVGWEL